MVSCSPSRNPPLRQQYPVVSDSSTACGACRCGSLACGASPVPATRREGHGADCVASACGDSYQPRRTPPHSRKVGILHCGVYVGRSRLGRPDLGALDDTPATRARTALVGRLSGAHMLSRRNTNAAADVDARGLPGRSSPRRVSPWRRRLGLLCSSHPSAQGAQAPSLASQATTSVTPPDYAPLVVVPLDSSGHGRCRPDRRRCHGSAVGRCSDGRQGGCGAAAPALAHQCAASRPSLRDRERTARAGCNSGLAQVDWNSAACARGLHQCSSVTRSAVADLRAELAGVGRDRIYRVRPRSLWRFGEAGVVRYREPADLRSAARRRSSGVALISDTDHGALDGNTSYDRAVGPMQFLPATWREYEEGASGHSTPDPQNINDATITAARYLCASGQDLRTADGLIAAVYGYNHSFDYVSAVLSVAIRYAGGTLPGGASALKELPALAQTASSLPSAFPTPLVHRLLHRHRRQSPMAPPTPPSSPSAGSSVSPSPPVYQPPPAGAEPVALGTRLANRISAPGLPSPTDSPTDTGSPTSTAPPTDSPDPSDDPTPTGTASDSPAPGSSAPASESPSASVLESTSPTPPATTETP